MPREPEIPQMRDLIQTNPRFAQLHALDMLTNDESVEYNVILDNFVADYWRIIDQNKK